METTTNEIELLHKSLTGNKEAFGIIVENYKSLICSITYAATGDFARSEELAQETFVIAWKELRQLKKLSKFRAWLCKIARNLAKKTIDKQSKDVIHTARPIESANAFVTSEQIPDQIAISKEQQTVIWLALQEIPEIYREPMVLFYRQQQSIKQVAAELDLSEDAIKQRLARGRKLLKAEMSSLVEDILGKTAPKKAFTVAVIAALPATKTSAMGLASSATTTGFIAILNSFWLPVSSVLVGLLVFLISGGYLFFIGFVAFSTYLILKEPNWFVQKNKRFLILTVVYLLMAVCFFSLGSIYASVIFFLFFIIQLLAFHPKCPENVKMWLWGGDELDQFYPWKKWEWKTLPKNWRSKLIFSVATTLAFSGTAIYFIYQTKTAVPWGYVAVAIILAIRFLGFSLRTIYKIWFCSKKEDR